MSRRPPLSNSRAATPKSEAAAAVVGSAGPSTIGPVFPRRWSFRHSITSATSRSKSGRASSFMFCRVTPRSRPRASIRLGSSASDACCMAMAWTFAMPGNGPFGSLLPSSTRPARSSENVVGVGENLPSWAATNFSPMVAPSSSLGFLVGSSLFRPRPGFGLVFKGHPRGGSRRKRGHRPRLRGPDSVGARRLGSFRIQGRPGLRPRSVPP